MESGSGSSNFSFLGSCKYKEDLYMISIFNGFSLMELFLNLGRKCEEIAPQNVILQYLAPHQNMYVTLNEDDDVRIMTHLYTSMRLAIINMRAVKKDDMGSHNLERFETEEETQTSNDDHLEVGLVRNSIDVWSHCIRGEGQIFKDAAEFRKCAKNYAVATKRSFLYKKNDNKKVILVCSTSNCSWRIYASRHKADKLFGIRKCNLIHTCGDDNLRSRGHPKADAAWVSNIVMDRLRGEPSYRPCMMLKDIHRAYGVELNYNKVWKGKELAMHDIHGVEEGAYDRLRWYCSAIKETNPGSFVECEIDHCSNNFKRLFICFNACATGFINGCRPLVFLDGTHIKNKYKGCILVAVAKDANDDLFTLAYSVVDAENDDNWGWFCFQLKSALLSHRFIGFHEFTFFSDRHPGIIKAIQLVFPGSPHACCLRHLVDNFVKQVMRSYPLHNKKYWSSVFKKAAYALSRQEFQEHINNIIRSMPLAKDFIVSSCPESWANACFLGNRWGVMNNNIAESWNNWVKTARFLPIVPMVDHIRIQIMDMMHRRREATMGMVKRLSPSKENALAKTYAESRSLKLRKACGWSFEVVDGDKSFAVDLSVMTCSCRAWQEKGDDRTKKKRGCIDKKRPTGLCPGRRWPLTTANDVLAAVPATSALVATVPAGNGLLAIVPDVDGLLAAVSDAGGLLAAVPDASGLLVAVPDATVSDADIPDTAMPNASPSCAGWR
ncbi:hypothetical protein ZIOFF_037498 [Zingiber officinale]|uniref:Transposase n=1 Tax=Zingiber officinale TaxID=94328 RepID=A0A8J5L9P7_ZINOF|nr:hypothetical protein ZIOFF_037498 [Zingiber officinale]